ncbi:benenodin family lasso peptide [Parasphingorhabdus sp. JC815]
MKEFDINDETVVDLGQASVETKGQAIFDIDVSGGPRLYAAGIAAD